MAVSRKAFFAIGLAMLSVSCRPASAEDSATSATSAPSSGSGGSGTGASGASTTGGSSATPDAGGPQISCLPASLSFGDVVAYESATLSLVCTNRGATGSAPELIIDPPLVRPRVFSIEFDPADSPNPSAGLAPGQGARILVHYSPATTSTDQGTITIHNNTGADVEIPVSGQGLPAEPCQFSVSPSFLNFGSVQVGSVSAVGSFDIQNTGSGLCFVEDLTTKDDATSSFYLLPTSPAPNPRSGAILLLPDAGALSDVTVSVEFAPTSADNPFTAEITYSVADSSGSAVSGVVHLSGSAPYVDESKCLGIETEGNFSEVVWPVDAGGVLCTASGGGIALINNCQADVTILSLTLASTSGDLEPQFAVTGPELPLTLQASSAAVVYQVAFNPTSEGLHSAQVTVAHNSQYSSTEIDSTVTLTGQTIPVPTETDNFVATDALSYALDNTPLFASGISVTLNGTRVNQLDGPNQPDWTYDATANAIDFTFRVNLKAGDAIAVTYPIGCK